MKVVVTLSAANAEPWMRLFREALPAAHVERREPNAAHDAEPRADYVVIAEPCRTVFDAQPAPKAAFTVAAGVGHVLRLSNLPTDMPLVRLEDAGMAEPMARYVLAAVLRFALRMDTYAVQQREARWEQTNERSPATVRIGVLGLGVIGSAVALALAAQGFAVRGYASTPKHIDGIDCFAGAEQRDSFLAGLDVLVNVLPLTPMTAGLLDARVFNLLADGAHIVNIGRGATLVEADLLAALDRGKLAGATLDVFAKEPLPPEHPFWSHPRVVVTPHVSGLTNPDKAVAQIVAKITRLERGETVTGLVDRQRGY
ncbi:MAG: 2-hydroxyacid dehydrogenase [Burkholderiaceae bacterium]